MLTKKLFINPCFFLYRSILTIFSSRKEINRSVFWGVVAFWVSLSFVAIFENKIALDLQKATCLPWTAYWIDSGRVDSVKRGDLLVFIPGKLMHVPNVAEKDQPFENNRVTKIAIGLPGDTVSIQLNDVLVNGVSIDVLVPSFLNIPVKQNYIHPITAEKLGKDPSDFVRTFVVPDDSYFMISTEERSFDGRYWGVLPKQKVIGKAYAVF
jgi:signal peptidase I